MGPCGDGKQEGSAGREEIRTDEAIVSCHVQPALTSIVRALDSIGNVHGLVGSELARWRERRQLDGCLWVGVVKLLILAPLLLLQVSLFLVDQVDLKGAFGAVGLVDVTGALARGSHGGLAWRPGLADATAVRK